MSLLPSMYSEMVAGSIALGRATTTEHRRPVSHGHIRLSSAISAGSLLPCSIAPSKRQTLFSATRRKSAMHAKLILYIKVPYGGIAMTCPKCCSKTKIWDSRQQDDAKRRRRECLSCGYRFITIEIDEDLYERMIKKNAVNTSR